jgi:hypothetical protein
MIRDSSNYCVAALASFLMATIVLGSAGVARASDSATQTVRMTVTEASVFDVPTTPVVLAAPVAPRADGVCAEALLVSRYTIIESSGETRVLTANWSEGDRAPAGCRLGLEISRMASLPPVEVEGITVSPVARRVLALSGSSSTGTTRPGGSTVKYTLEVGDRAAINRGEHQAVTVTLTLIDLS